MKFIIYLCTQINEIFNIQTYLVTYLSIFRPFIIGKVENDYENFSESFQANITMRRNLMQTPQKSYKRWIDYIPLFITTTITC